MTALDEPSPSLAHLQARQRLAWAAGLHPRLGMASATVGHVDTALYTKVCELHPHSAHGRLAPFCCATRSGCVRSIVHAVSLRFLKS